MDPNKTSDVHATLAQLGFALMGLCLLIVSPTVAQQGTKNVRTYRSSVDGVEIQYLEYLPAAYDSTKPYPLLLYLHGGGGTMQAIPGSIHQAADRYQYIVVSIDGRPLSNPSQYSFCRSEPCPSPFYFDSPVTGPGEQDVLDMLFDVKRRQRINEKKVYLAGFSMGGWGTWGLGLRNPGLFAAIAPAGAPTDGYHMRQRDFIIAQGDDPVTTTDPVVRTRWLMISARWLIENAMNTPVHAFHGNNDTSVPNDTTQGRYAHAHHVTDVSGWSDQWGTAITLRELATQFPGSYVGEGTWVPNAGHTTAVIHPDTLFQFFDRYELDPNPRQIGFKTYEDVHTTAYWGRIEIARPWSTQYGLFRVTRYPEQNSFSLAADGESIITLDLPRMEIKRTRSIRFQVGPLNNYTGNISLKLKGGWTRWNAENYSLKKDGLLLTANADYSVNDTLLQIHAFSISTSHSFEMGSPLTGVEHRLSAPASFDLEQNFPNPFNPATTIRFSLPHREHVALKVFDAIGREVATLVDGELDAGEHAVVLDAKDLPSGVYVYRLTTGTFIQQKKMVVIQ